MDFLSREIGKLNRFLGEIKTLEALEKKKREPERKIAHDPECWLGKGSSCCSCYGVKCPCFCHGGLNQ